VDTHLNGFWYSNFFWVLPDKHVYMALVATARRL
jgi:hypothetical protein